ncbi:MAG: tripartite tricarboxylate transporter substrate binding protein [Xanthobacteraceae bacterium]|nr:tripartite tricarboxylate transporter substrate binding protein [Xanthobacteraceae bacterium]
MTKRRHRVAAIAMLLVASVGFGPSAFGQAYPARTITILTPFAAGSVTDAAARVVALTLQETLGQSVVVENRAGAGGLLAASAVARASNDGYTLLLTTNSTHSVVYGLFKNVPYDPIKDFTPIARIGSFASYVGVTPDKPYQSMKALVDYARANPGKLSYGVGNSTTQIVMETLKKRTGTDIVRVPYRSNPMVMTDLLGGQIQIMVADFNTGLPQLKAGKVNALAVLTRDRNPALPDVPTLSETVMPGYHILAWAGMFGPAGMSPEAVKVLADAVQKALEKPEVRARFAGAGTDVYWSGPKEFTEFVKTELVSWTAMIKEAGIEPE